MKNRIKNLESSIQKPDSKAPGTTRARWTGTPESGKRRYGTAVFSRIGAWVSRLFPALPTFSHFDFFMRDETGVEYRIQPRRIRGSNPDGGGSVRLPSWKSVKIFMVFHAFSRFITEIRAVIPRFSRFSGWDQFFNNEARFAANSRDCLKTRNFL